MLSNTNIIIIVVIIILLLITFVISSIVASSAIQNDSNNTSDLSFDVPANTPINFTVVSGSDSCPFSGYYKDSTTGSSTYYYNVLPSGSTCVYRSESEIKIQLSRLTEYSIDDNDNISFTLELDFDNYTYMSLKSNSDILCYTSTEYYPNIDGFMYQYGVDCNSYSQNYISTIMESGSVIVTFLDN